MDNLQVIIRAAQMMTDAVNNFSKIMAEGLAPVIKSIVDVWDDFYASLPEEYKQAIEAEIRRDKIKERNRRKYQRMMERRR